MFRKFGLITALLITCFSGSALAAMVGEPMIITESGKWTISVEDNYIYKTSIKATGQVTGGEIKNVNQIYGKINYDLLKNLGIYLKIGTANLEQKLKWDIGVSQTIKYDYGLFAGAGLKCHFPLVSNFGVGGDAQVNWWHNKARTITGTDDPSLIDKGTIDNLNAQGTIYLDYNYALNDKVSITPYAGIYYSYFRSFEEKDRTFHDSTYTYTGGDIETRHPVGPVAGLSVKINKNLSLNIEGRFVAETAISGGASFRF